MLEDGPTSVATCSAAADEEFESQLQTTIADAYSALRQRVERAGFAAWHRGQSLEVDLAHHAIVLFTLHCRKHQKIPDNVLAYLVKIAKNLASRAMRDYLTARDATAEARVDPANEASGRIHSEEDLTFDGNPTPAVDARVEHLRAEIERLPRRQREAIELWIKNPDRTQRELGEDTGVSEDAYQKNFTRGLARIRQAIGSQRVTGNNRVED